MLAEGGNVFKDTDGHVKTKRINLQDIAPTVTWLERVTGLPLKDNMLGSTGLKPTSGDLDLAVDANRVTKDALSKQLSDYVLNLGQNPGDWIKKSGISIHFLTPIRGDLKQGYVQTDFMFVPKPAFSKFILRQDLDSDYKGSTRNVLINSMAKSLGYKLNQTAGIQDRASNDIISDDPDIIAKMLLNDRATKQDLGSVERIFRALANDPNREAKIADFREHMQREGLPLPADLSEGDAGLMARLRDRIINQGMQVIIEQEQALRKDPRIPHPEDFVFMGGSQGAARAVQGLEYAGKNAGDITIKWDGMPALIFGRMPDGRLAVMDKYMFDRGFAAMSPRDWQRYDQEKVSGKTRPDLYPKLATVWPLLDAATQAPGFFWGDLLWTGQLQPDHGRYRFQPNKVLYSIPVTNNSQKTIGVAKAGIAVHQHFDNLADKTARTWNGKGLADIPGGVAILRPAFGNRFQIKPPNLRAARAAISKYGDTVDQLLDSLPGSTRQRLQTYFNQHITGGTTLSLHNWLKGNGVSAKQYRELVTGNPDAQGQYNTATGNVPGKLFALTQNNTVIPSEAYTGLLTIWNAVYQAKLAMVQQLQSQVVGLEQQIDGQTQGEGFVINTPQGLIKLVNRGVFGGGRV